MEIIRIASRSKPGRTSARQSLGASAPSTNTSASLVTSSEKRISKNMASIIEQLGEDTEREGLRKTPQRYAKAMRFLTSGYEADIQKIVNGAIFHEETGDTKDQELSDLVIVRDIELFSLCEHHLLPFFGKAHVAYLPNGKVIGLSKIPRLLNVFARRLQLQERLTRQLAEELTRILNPRGVAVVIEAYHMCMMMRGVEKQKSFTVTRSLKGVFKTDPQARRDFYDLLNQPRLSERD